MSSRNIQDVVGKKKRYKSKKSKLNKKCTIRKSIINYGLYFCKVLKKLHPTLSLSLNSVNILNSFGHDMFQRIASEASSLASYTNHKTIHASEIQSAIRLVLPPGLRQEAAAFGIKAVIKYYLSKKGSISKKSLEMTEESDQPEVWHKCFSKKKNLVYFWNCATQESIWEEDSGKLFKKHNVKIIDQTKEMKNGKIPVIIPKVKTSAESKNGTTTKMLMLKTTGSKSVNRSEDEDDDDDDKDFNGMLHAFIEISQSSPSSSQGSSSNHEASGYGRRHSEPKSKSRTTENSVERRKSAEIPPPNKPKTCSRPTEKLTNHENKSSNIKFSVPPIRPGIAKEANVCQSKFVKEGSMEGSLQETSQLPSSSGSNKQRAGNFVIPRRNMLGNAYGSGSGSMGASVQETSQLPSSNGSNKQKAGNFVIPRRNVLGSDSGMQKLFPKKEHKTPIQDRKMREKKELLLKQKQRASLQKTNQLPSSNGSNKQKAGNFVIPRRNVLGNAYGSDSGSIGGSPQETSQLPSSDGSNKQIGGNFVIPRRNMRVNAHDSGSGRDSQCPSQPRLPRQVSHAAGSVTSTGTTTMSVPPPCEPQIQEFVKSNIKCSSPFSSLTFKSEENQSTEQACSTSKYAPKHAQAGSMCFVGESNKRKVDSARVQETVTSQSKLASPALLKRVVRSKNSVDKSNETDRVRETFTSPPKYASPTLLKRVVRSKNPVDKSNETDRVQENVQSQCKDPALISPPKYFKQVVGRINPVEESNGIHLFPDGVPGGSGLRKRRIDDGSVSLRERKLSSDSDSNSSASADFKRTRVSTEFLKETPTGITANTVRPTTALESVPFDARQKILRNKRNRQSQEIIYPSCSNQDTHTMEWEETTPGDDGCNQNVKERLVQPSTSTTQNPAKIITQLQYKPVVIVCDTNALIHHKTLIEYLLGGSLLGIPVTLVIPYQVIRELDDINQRPDGSAAEGARAAIRLIHNITDSKLPSQYNLVLQDGTMHRKLAKTNLTLEKNDDFVLKCAVQEKEAHGEDKVVILLTGDHNLRIVARMEFMESVLPSNLKAWARDYKEKARLKALGMTVESQDATSAIKFTRENGPEQPNETAMDVDVDPDVLSSNTGSAQIEKPLPRSCNQFVAESLNHDLLQFLNNVIVNGNERLYGSLKHHASQPRPSWTLIQCINAVVGRWEALTDKRLSQHMRDNIKQIITLVKKFNQGLEEFSRSDMKNYFECSQSLAKEFIHLYNDVSNIFLTRLTEQYEEWEHNSRSSAVSLCEEDDLQPADMALQNIYNCMTSDYISWKEKVEKAGGSGVEKKDMEVRLKAFHTKAKTMLLVMNKALEYPQSSLSVGDDCIYDFLKETTTFESEDRNILTFDLTRENILALLNENNLRKRVEAMVENIRVLQTNIMDLLEELNNSDDDLDFD